MAASPIPPAARRAVRERISGRCLRCGAPAPHGHWHHRRSRSVQDEHTHSPGNGAWLCGTCHTWVHAHPFEARATGFIVSRHTLDPGTQPVQSYAGWMLLDRSGAFAFVTD